MTLFQRLIHLLSRSHFSESRVAGLRGCMVLHHIWRFLFVGDSKGSRSICDCRITFLDQAGPSEGVLQLLGKQLERCGPTQLAPAAACQACPSFPPCPTVTCLGCRLELIVTLILGILVGALGAQFFLQRCTRASALVDEPVPSGAGRTQRALGSREALYAREALADRNREESSHSGERPAFITPKAKGALSGGSHDVAGHRA